MNTPSDVSTPSAANAFQNAFVIPALPKQSLINTLKEIQLILEIDDARWRELGGLTIMNWRKIQEGGGHYSADQIIQLSQSLGINIELLLKGEIDYKALIHKWKKDSIILPEKYLVFEKFFSRARSTQLLLQHIQLKYGIGKVLRALGRLQIHQQSILIDPTAETSSQINIDLLKELMADGVPADEFIQAGSLNLAIMKCSEIGEKVARLHSPKEVYQTIFESYYPKLESLTQVNFLKLSNDGCILAFKIPERVQDGFHSPIVGIRENCLVRQGAVRSVLGLIRNSFAACKELSCIYRGDPHCSFEVTWEVTKLHSLHSDTSSDIHNNPHLLNALSNSMFTSFLPTRLYPRPLVGARSCA